MKWIFGLGIASAVAGITLAAFNTPEGAVGGAWGLAITLMFVATMGWLWKEMEL